MSYGCPQPGPGLGGDADTAATPFNVELAPEPTTGPAADTAHLLAGGVSCSYSYWTCVLRMRFGGDFENSPLL